MLVLSREDVMKVLPYSELFDPLKEGFKMLANGNCQMPLRTVIDMEQFDGVSLFMPAYGENVRSTGLKLVTVMNENPSKNLPLIHSVYLYVSAETGEILSLMDAEYLTSARTAVASALATAQLNKAGGSVLGIFGTGVQAWAHVQAFTDLFKISEIMIFPFNDKLGSNFRKQIEKEIGTPCRIADETQLKDADIICTCTTNVEPLFPLSAVKPSVHINPMGAYRPHTREIGSDVVAASLLVVDSYEGALSEAGELVIPIEEGVITKEHIFASLDEVISGNKKLPDTSQQVTLFKSLGMAMEDLVAADQAYQRAKAQGIGKEISL